MGILDWFYSLTPHQLDALRTLASIATGIGGFLSGVAVVYARLGAKRSKIAVDQTATKQWTDGQLHSVSVAELTHQAVHNTEEFRGELTHFTNDPPIHGRRRLPTHATPIVEESHYE